MMSKTVRRVPLISGPRPRWMITSVELIHDPPMLLRPANAGSSPWTEKSRALPRCQRSDKGRVLGRTDAFVQHRQHARQVAPQQQPGAVPRQERRPVDADDVG